MPEIKLGSLTPVDVRLGSAAVELYLGATKVWPQAAMRTMPGLIHPTGAYFTPPGDHEPVNTVDLTPAYHASDVLAGDLILAMAAVHDPGAAPGVAALGGFTALTAVGGSTALFGAPSWKLAAGNEDGTTETVAWSSSNAAGDIAIATLFQFRNVEAGDPFDDEATPASGTLTDPGLPTLTSTVPNCLAVAIQIYSDNTTVGSPPVPSGATGGTWVLAAHHRDITTGDDVGMAVFTAELAEPARSRAAASRSPRPRRPESSPAPSASC